MPPQAAAQSPPRTSASLRDEALRLAVARAAAVWLDCGVLPGEQVAIVLDESADSMLACLGATLAGGEAVSIDPRTPAHEWASQGCPQRRWRFILCQSREEHPAELRDFILTRTEWRRALETVSLPGAGLP